MEVVSYPHPGNHLSEKVDSPLGVMRLSLQRGWGQGQRLLSLKVLSWAKCSDFLPKGCPWSQSVIEHGQWILGAAFSLVGKQTRKQTTSWIRSKTSEHLGQGEHPSVPGRRDSKWQVVVIKMMPEGNPIPLIQALEGCTLAKIALEFLFFWLKDDEMAGHCRPRKLWIKKIQREKSGERGLTGIFLIMKGKIEFKELNNKT